ncbi:MAG TPA: SpoIIE family protein phosphatase [Azospirillaceae bacterium]|nr:SpoIIE family protein phosphatase [Azospirillaceae bacterium]
MIEALAAAVEADATPSLADFRVLLLGDGLEGLAPLLDALGIVRTEAAGDQAAALDLLTRMAVDLVVVDADMAGGGLAACRAIRASQPRTELPVLMVTRPDGRASPAECFGAGASDVLVRPLVAAEAAARIRLQLERLHDHRDLAIFRRRLQSDLKLARNMQLSLIPDQRVMASVGGRQGLAIEGHFEPSDELGGDFWTLFELGPDRLGILVVDFSGHGISAAINTFRFHTLISRIQPHGYEPAEWLGMLNRPLKDLLPVGQFATAFYCILDRTEGTISYAAAGAPGPILWHEGRARMLDASGLMLGVSASPLLTSDVVPFPPGASLLIYSDAMTEALDRGGHAVGEDGLSAMVAEALAGGAGRLGRLLAAFDRRVPRPLADDLTAICVTRGT